jgi:hypothetical protein
VKRGGWLLGVASTLLVGCGTVNFDAPEGRRVKLLTREDPTSVRVERRLWYALWGGKPLSENHTAPLIEEFHLGEVRMATRQNVLDTLITTVTGVFSITCRTLIVEGNPDPAAAAKP